MASLRCLEPWQGRLEGWAWMEPSAGERTYGISSAAAVRASCVAAPDSRGHSSHKQGEAAQPCHFLHTPPVRGSACPDSRGGDIDSGGRSLMELAVLF